VKIFTVEGRGIQIQVAGTDNLVKRVYIREKALANLDRKQENGLSLSPLFQKLREDLKSYLSGKKVDFSPYPLDMNSVSSKARRILQVVREIPYGEVRSYRWVALKLKNRGYRAVGRIMSINPFPIIVPCHRVIYADGTLGGFSGGISLKKRLLEIEGIHILPLISKVV